MSWPSWLTYSGWLTHISGHPSAAGRAQDRESSPARDRSSTTVPCHQLYPGSPGQKAVKRLCVCVAYPGCPGKEAIKQVNSSSSFSRPALQRLVEPVPSLFHWVQTWHCLDCHMYVLGAMLQQAVVHSQHCAGAPDDLPTWRTSTPFPCNMAVNSSHTKHTHNCKYCLVARCNKTDKVQLRFTSHSTQNESFWKYSS